MRGGRARAVLGAASALTAGALAVGFRDRRRRAAVDDLNARLVGLERRIDAERRHAADAVHALRAPLTAMRAELDVTLRDEGLPPGAREVLASLREEVDAMSRSADDLLTLAAIDEDVMRLRPVQVDLLDASQAAAGPFRAVASAKRLTMHLGGESGYAFADAERLHQALGTLIDNAVRFTPPGGDVRVTAWCAAERVGVTVTDSGPGISAAARAHLFERFYRVPPTGSSPPRGSGLGLAICREIATAHGGSVSVESEPGRGSTFTLALPRSPGPPA
jgi:two-component system, OmpR family, sensor histidine kinase BaeS